MENDPESLTFGNSDSTIRVIKNERSRVTKQQIITLYDTGERLEPKAWHAQPRNLPSEEGAEHYGRVDFDDDEGGVVLTAYVERTPIGYAVRIENAAESVAVTIAAVE